MDSHQPIHILIAGCGDIGLQFAKTNSQFTCTGIRRQPQAASSPITWIQADLTQPQTLNSLPKVDYVIYTATPDQRTETGYAQAYLDGLRNCVDALDVDRIKRFFFVSSTSVYGQQDGSWIDESSPTEPNHFSGKTLLEAESWLKQHPICSTVIRFSGIYGPGRFRLLRKVASTDVQVQREPAKYTNRIHRDDCAAVLAHLIRLHEDGHQVEDCYLASDCLPAAEWDVMRWLADELNAPPPSAQENSPASQQNKRCNNARLLNSGYIFKYPDFQAGYRELLAEFLVSSDSS